MAQTPDQIEIQHLKDDLKKAFGRIISLEADLKSFQKAESEKEAKTLRTALMTAGAIILALGGFLFQEVIWPLIKAGPPR